MIRENRLAVAPMNSVVSCKFIIIGDSGVGKTAILRRLIENSFSEISQTTVGVEFDSKMLTIGDRKMKLQIWDTAGQERFKSIARAYYRGAVGVILVFDITDRKSFDDLSNWLNDVQSLCNPSAVIQLIGNKFDLIDRRDVTSSEAESFAERHSMNYLETSAKAGDNIGEAFVRVATPILKQGLASTPVLDKSPLVTDTPVLVNPAGEPAAKPGCGC
jgi:small GTP-binding protein